MLADVGWVFAYVQTRDLYLPTIYLLPSKESTPRDTVAWTVIVNEIFGCCAMASATASITSSVVLMLASKRPVNGTRVSVSGWSPIAIKHVTNSSISSAL